MHYRKTNHITAKKTAIISDIHSNFQALRAVLAHAEKQGVDQFWFLGDAVGYGPAPNRCLLLLKEIIPNPQAWVLGNHDIAMRYPPAPLLSRRSNSRSPGNTGDAGNSGSANNADNNDKKENRENRESRENRGNRGNNGNKGNKGIRNDSHNNQNNQTDLNRYIGSSKSNLDSHRLNYELMQPYPNQLADLLSHQETSQFEDKFFLVHGGLRNGSPSTTYIWDKLDAQQEFTGPIFMITRETKKKLKQENIPSPIIQKLERIINSEIIGEEMFRENLRTALGHKDADKYHTTILANAAVEYKKRFPANLVNIFFFGNTHHPACFKGDHREQKALFHTIDLQPQVPLQLDDENAWYLNPGSVGQPRDGDNRAAYMTLDRTDQTLRLHRVPYNIRATQKEMEELDFPINLISRLQLGR